MLLLPMKKHLVGDEAKNQYAWNPTNSVWGIKRMIGRNFSDPVVQDDMQHWPFKVVRGDRPKVEVQWKGETNPELIILIMANPNLKD